jgi:hypothetical protein
VTASGVSGGWRFAGSGNDFPARAFGLEDAAHQALGLSASDTLHAFDGFPAGKISLVHLLV